jgi:hypothetical protein
MRFVLRRRFTRFGTRISAASPKSEKRIGTEEETLYKQKINEKILGT